MSKLFWEDNIQSQLLHPEAISQIIPYMTKSFMEDRRSTESKHDPITATAIVFLTCPLHLGLTEVGAMLFQGHASLVYPFTLMSESQKQFLRDCLDRREEWNILNDAVLFRRTRADPPKTLDQSTVLTALCDQIVRAASSRDEKARLALCNIVLQRLQGYITIDKPIQKELHSWLAQRRRVDAADI